MATNDQPPGSAPGDNQDTAILGSAPPTPIGTILNDRYLLVRQLSEGGFGTVHLAHDQQMHGRQVVVKIQINQRVDDPWFERKFSEEVRALSMIDHPGVVVAIDNGRTPDGKPFLVMQYVDGVTLRAAMSPDGMPLERAAGILKQVGHALAAAHDKGIWHRDLKPENLMLQQSTDGEDRVRLIDFGIATVADIRSKYQTNTRVSGSVQYMAPEQIAGHPSALTDIYAMGLIAYEMVTGRKAFAAENAGHLAALQQLPVRVKPTDLRPALPLTAERLILQSLEYEPSRRPRNARAFGDQLHDALLESDATRITTPPSWPKSRERKKWLIGGVGAVAAMLAGGVFYESRNPPAPPQTAAPDRALAPSAQDTSGEQAVELAFWNSVKDSTEPQLYREYLAKYPHGRFESLATAKLAILARKDAQKPVSAKTDTPKPASQAHEEEVELAFWDSVKDATDPQLYQDYLDKYPHGRFESLARTKLDLLNKRPQARGGRGQRGGGGPGRRESGNHAGLDPATAAELADWNALKDVKDPQPYRDFLAKYPHGMFAAVAKIKLDALEAGSKQVAPADGDGVTARRKVGMVRRARSLDNYRGPQEGEIYWAGAIPRNGGLIIQGGIPSWGTISSDLPRVPITVEVVKGGVNILELPSELNHWDRLALRNHTGAPVTEIVIRWKVAK